MATATARTRGKTEFVKEVLGKNPLANATAVNKEWKSAGHDGTISATLVNKLRSALGLTGNLRSTTKPKTPPRSTEKLAYSRKKREGNDSSVSSKTITLAASGTNGRKTERAGMQTLQGAKINRPHGSLDELEVDIDRLLFKVMRLGRLPDVEESLRQTRRLLFGRFSRERS